MKQYELFINGEFIPNGNREMLKVDGETGAALIAAYENNGEKDYFVLFTSMTKDSKDIAELSEEKGSVIGTVAEKNGVIGLGIWF